MTVTPLIGAPVASRTSTRGLMANVEPGSPDWLSPDVSDTMVAIGGVTGGVVGGVVGLSPEPQAHNAQTRTALVHKRRM
ncbi:MAG: hypothetical protein IT353_16295 [Gemmatimonadaceae bacterium]|nr:hypothetical protein [Gemmatimonadaceae bacterium]